MEEARGPNTNPTRTIKPGQPAPPRTWLPRRIPGKNIAYSFLGWETTNISEHVPVVWLVPAVPGRHLYIRIFFSPRLGCRGEIQFQRCYHLV
ncbi:MAG: hypothetical protein DRO11_01720 [Methanobacteriota archaeon]|nr:MAG: hypothetical protein DRO11_01720 [Euryarchaeota archaeon]